LTCEAVIIGGGITGALLSHALTRAGVDTVLVDREDIGTGSTAASTGLLQYEIDTPLIDLIQRIGEQPAVHAYRRGLAAVDELGRLTESLGDSCGFARRSTLCLASSPADYQELRREHECRRHFGFDVQCFDSGQLHDFCGLTAPGALYSSGDGEIDAYRLTQAVLQHARRAGLRAFRETPITKVATFAPKVTLTTPRGQIVADAAFFTTGYAAHEFLPNGPGDLQSTYVAASEPLDDVPRWPERCLIWETARPYFYARRTEDGRALVGGEDTSGPFDHLTDDVLAAKASRLAARFERYFPETKFTPAYAWAGTFAESSDGLPYIGPLPGHERIHLALAYGGNGITFGMIAANLLTDLFLRRPNADAPVFSFDR
jgi:glycine/D-amino acid oxidase-like deaminating enzyme